MRSNLPLARAAAALLLVAACAPPARHTSAPAPDPLSAADVRSIAGVLKAADERQFDEPLLQAAAADPHPEVRRQAVLGMARLRDPAALPLLSHLLADADTAVAATAAFAIGQVGDTAGVAALLPLVSLDAARNRGPVSAEAAAALGKLRTTRARGALVQLLATAPVAEPAWTAAVGEALLGIWRYPRGDDYPAIVRWTQSRDPAVRWRAVYALVRRPDPRAAHVLLPRLDDADATVRALAARGLSFPVVDSAAMQESTVVDALIARLQDEAYPVRVNALRSLASFDAPAAAGVLAAVLSNGEPNLSFAAAEAAMRTPLEARSLVEPLRDVAGDAERPIPVRATALAALARLAPAEAQTFAAELVEHPSWQLRAAAARAIATSDGAPTPPLLRLVRDPDGRVAAAALDAWVQSVGDTARVPQRVLLEALGHADLWLRATALEALAKQPAPELLPVLLEAYARARSDTTNDAALAALNALGALADTGVPVTRALFARFPRPADPLVRERAIARFGAAATTAWGEARPVDTGLAIEQYEELTRRWIAPAAAGAPLPRVFIRTEAGTIAMELFAADAPLTAENWVRLARGGFFDGQRWPRVVPNFVIQGGDPRGDTNGGPGYGIRDELNRNRYLTGTLGMALSGPDTGGSQFFITHSPQPHLDGTYTVFGRVVQGMEVVNRVLPGDVILEAGVTP